jgi:hypothetical protein
VEKKLLLAHHQPLNILLLPVEVAAGQLEVAAGRVVF